MRGHVGERPRVAVRQIGGQRPGGAPGLHVEDEVSDHERVLGGHAHCGGGVQDAVGCRLEWDLVVAGDYHVEVVGVQAAKPRQRPSHGGQAVPREDADPEPLLAQASEDALGVRVGLGRGGGGQLEACQRGQCALASRARRQRLDPFEDETPGGAADLTFDGGEIEGPGTRERAVEIEEHGPQTKRPRAVARHLPA